MKIVKIWYLDEEVKDWIFKNCHEVEVVQYLLSPVSLTRKPYKIQFNNEQEYLMYLLRCKQ